MLIREYISVMSTPALLSYSGQCKSKQSTLLSLGLDAQQNGLAVIVGKLHETYCMYMTKHEKGYGRTKKRHHYSDTSISWYHVLVTTVKETTGNVGLGHLAISWKTIITPSTAMSRPNFIRTAQRLRSSAKGLQAFKASGQFLEVLHKITLQIVFNCVCIHVSSLRLLA